MLPVPEQLGLLPSLAAPATQDIEVIRESVQVLDCLRTDFLFPAKCDDHPLRSARNSAGLVKMRTHWTTTGQDKLREWREVLIEAIDLPLQALNVSSFNQPHALPPIGRECCQVGPKVKQIVLDTMELLVHLLSSGRRSRRGLVGSPHKTENGIELVDGHFTITFLAEDGPLGLQENRAPPEQGRCFKRAHRGFIRDGPVRVNAPTMDTIF